MESNSCMFSNSLHFLQRHWFSSPFSFKMHTVTYTFYIYACLYTFDESTQFLPIQCIIFRLASSKKQRSVPSGLPHSELNSVLWRERRKRHEVATETETPKSSEGQTTRGSRAIAVQFQVTCLLLPEDLILLLCRKLSSCQYNSLRQDLSAKQTVLMILQNQVSYLMVSTRNRAEPLLALP